MNQLSMLLYLGNVAGNLGPFFVAFGVVFIIGCVISVIVSMVYDECHTTDGDNRVRKRARRYSLLFGPLAVLFMLGGTLCPSRDTVYAIAASQLGEQVIKTPLAGKAEQALEAWLNRQITPVVAPASQ